MVATVLPLSSGKPFDNSESRPIVEMRVSRTQEELEQLKSASGRSLSLSQSDRLDRRIHKLEIELQKAKNELDSWKSKTTFNARNPCSPTSNMRQSCSPTINARHFVLNDPALSYYLKESLWPRLNTTSSRFGYGIPPTMGIPTSVVVRKTGDTSVVHIMHPGIQGDHEVSPRLGENLSKAWSQDRRYATPLHRCLGRRVASRSK